MERIDILSKKDKEICDNCAGNNYPIGDYCQACNMTNYRKNKNKIPKTINPKK